MNVQVLMTLPEGPIEQFGYVVNRGLIGWVSGRLG